MGDDVVDFKCYSDLPEELQEQFKTAALGAYSFLDLLVRANGVSISLSAINAALSVMIVQCTDDVDNCKELMILQAKGLLSNMPGVVRDKYDIEESWDGSVTITFETEDE